MISGIKKIFSFLDKSKPDYDHDIILTGLPRAGTTLSCRLLSATENTIGLNEPMAREYFPDRESGLLSIDQQFIAFRKTLLKDGTAKARTSGGKVSDNNFEKKKGKRHRIVERTTIRFNKDLDRDFLLVMKHCAEFSLILPDLQQKYKCFALVRNPLALLGSWSSVDVPVSRGKVAKSLKLNPAFHHELETHRQLMDRQLFIMQWYYGQFLKLPSDRVIRYEDIIKSGGTALKVISPAAVKLNENFRNQNTSDLYDRNMMERFAERLLQTDGAIWEFYEKSEVERLLNHA